jgi:hypothetical protein
MAQRRTDLETELEDEAFLGGLGAIAGSLLGEGELEEEYEAEEELEGEFEDEFEDEVSRELEDEWEDEDEAFLSSLGGIARTVGSLLGETEEEYEDEAEWEDEAEDEAEEFFKSLGRAFRAAAPVLRVIAKTAGPLVATAVGGPAAGALARAVTSQLEGEMEAELEAEFEDMATAPVTAQQALGEYLAARAATAGSESEAEAFVGAAVQVTLSAQDRRDLGQLLPHLVRGAAVITRLLHQNPRSRPAVRLVPGIVDATARTLVRTGDGGWVDPAYVGRTLGHVTGRVLAGGPATTAVAHRHARGLAYTHRQGHRSGWWGPGHRPGRTRHGAPHRAGHRGSTHPSRVVRRAPTGTRIVSRSGRVAPPKAGHIRVVTPVRVPGRGGRPAQTVRVVSDVKVPRGAKPAGRPAAVPARRKAR